MKIQFLLVEQIMLVKIMLVIIILEKKMPHNRKGFIARLKILIPNSVRYPDKMEDRVLILYGKGQNKHVKIIVLRQW